jgi:hypothetical protein
MAGMKRVSDDSILRTVRLKESLVMKVRMKKLFLYAVTLVPMSLNLMIKKKVTIISHL